MANESKLEMASVYLDDGVMAGDAHAVAKTMARIQRENDPVGLKFDLGNNELVTTCVATPTTCLNAFPRRLTNDIQTGICREQI